MSIALRNQVVTVVLTHVLQKTEKCRFYPEIGGCYKGTIVLKNSVPNRSIPFKCIFVCLEKALMRGKNEREIPLTLYIRLEYNDSQADIIEPFKSTSRYLEDLLNTHNISKVWEDKFIHLNFS